ncbi:FimV/HubP family polar landmark protein [Methylophaga sp.]|uniref:FimV/HubP family polar landmark protein n=1 Tax=Methylophaga sp. TaxID=2024840 RepID=UPI0025E96CBE|nr:FimV/HubP family polar landmark protein [Methylophaga sp.]
MKQKTLTSLSVAAALGLLTPLPGYAFGLGQITLYSALNEPFRAEIEVNALQDDEQGNLEVRLGSSQDFERAGLERSFLLTQLNFEVIEESDSTRILVTSDIPIKEPFLGFLLAATTGQGKLLREYTVLLDPPKELYRGRDTVESSRAPVSQSTVPATPRTTSPNRTASASDRVTQYNVQSRDTLWSIAERTRPSGDITMQQMMIGLLNANPRAFQQDNVNSLYAGSTLRIPATEEITRLSANEAKAAVDRQNLEWQQRNLAQTASPVATVDDVSASENNAAAGNNEIEPEIEAANDAEDPSNLTESEETISDAESARLKLIAATENSLLEADPVINGDPDLQRISEQLTLAQETIESQTQENIDFKNRMDAMERQLDTMRRLISLKDADMARLQSLLEQDETQMDLATLVDEANTILENSEADSEALNDGDNNTNLDDPSEEATNPDVVDDDWQPVDIADESTELETVTNADSPELTASELDENTVEASETAELETAAGEVDAAIVEAAQELNLDQQQLDSLYQRVQAFVIAHKVESLLAILLLLLIIWMIIRRGQREVSWDDAVNKINKNKPATTTAETGSVNIVTPVAEEKESTTASQTKSVDELVEQADMFVGYADYVQAGTALEQAHRQAPEDKEITAKLLFIYYKQQKSADFIALLNTSGIDENDPQWPDVRNWGAQLLPHNPLFAESSEAAEVAIEESTEEVQTSLDTEDEPQGDVETEEEMMETSSEPEESDHIDFNLDDYKTDSTTTSKTEEVYQRDEEDLLQFDSSTSAEKDPEAELEQSETDTYPEDDDLRIDFEQDNVLQPDSSAPDVLDLNIDETDDVSDQQAEEVLSVDSLDADELDLTNFETEEPTETEDVDVIEDYLNLDSSADDDELDFDLSDFDSIDESETKLDLAAAYSDMGDPEGARGILEEVLEQGTDEQKKRAQELLDTLS